MAVSAHDAAHELRYKLPACGVVKVHKLLYLAQGWHLAWYGEPMFSEDIEAWQNGPVVADLWRDEKRGYDPPPAEPLAGSHQLILDLVASRYGELTGRELIELTHAKGPWRRVFSAGPDGVITTTDLTEFFSSIDRLDSTDHDDDDDWRVEEEEYERIRRSMTEAAAHASAGSARDETADIRAWLLELTS